MYCVYYVHVNICIVYIMYIYVRICIYIYISFYLQAHLPACFSWEGQRECGMRDYQNHVCYTHIYVHTHTYILYQRMCLYINICIYECVYIHIYVYALKARLLACIFWLRTTKSKRYMMTMGMPTHSRKRKYESGSRHQYCVCVRVCMCACMYVCMYVCMCITHMFL